MSLTSSAQLRLRMERSDWKRLGWALVIAVVVHILLFVVLVVWVGVAVILMGVHQAKTLEAKTNSISVKAKDHEPFMFVDVREAQAVTEPPKDAKRYSDRNAIATNPDANQELNEPKIDGEKNELQKLEDAGKRNKFDQLMPDPVKPEAESKPKLAPGTMTVAKADLRPPQEKQRPRTIREAMLQKQQTPGQRSKQDGGLARRGQISQDVRMTGFGPYDRALIEAVENQWYNLLDNLSYDNYQQGKVVVEFTLNYKGSISDLKILESTVSERLALMCEKAIRDPASAGGGYGEWTREMRLAVGEDSRRITFTFYYN